MGKLISPERPAVRLWRAHFEATINQIRITGTWYQSSPGNWTPCLALSDGRKHPARCVLCIIPLETAWIWAFHGDVGSPARAFESITYWLKEGLLPGEVNNAKDYMRIVVAVNERLSDLMAMPPHPLGEEVAVGTIRIINPTTGEVISESEVTTDV